MFSFVGDLLTGDSPEIVVNALANAFGPWVVIAFVAGIVAARPTAGAWAGPLALMVAVIAYYAVFLVVWGDRLADVRITIVVWLAAALVAGGIFGTAGGAWSAEPRWRPLATAMLCGGLLAEAAYQAVELAGCDCLDATRPALYVVIVDALIAVVAPHRAGRARPTAADVRDGSGPGRRRLRGDRASCSRWFGARSSWSNLIPDTKNRPPCVAGSVERCAGRSRRGSPGALVSVRRQRVQTSALVGTPFCSITSGCRFGL